MFLISDSDFSVTEVKELECGYYHFRYAECQNRQIQNFEFYMFDLLQHGWHRG